MRLLAGYDRHNLCYAQGNAAECGGYIHVRGVENVAAAGHILALASTYLIANWASSYHVCSGCTAVEMHT